MNVTRKVWMSLQFLVGGMLGLVIAISNAHAASVTLKAVGSSSAGATCANPKPLTLPVVLSGVADTCLVTSGTIDGVGSRGAETFTIKALVWLVLMVVV